MTEPARVDDWIRTEIARQLAAVNACAAGWDQPTQTRFLRLLVERGLEKIDATEGEYYDFMTQCALLAGENMQDARLQVLEQQVDELRNPPFSLAETLLDAALIMMGEVIIAGTAYYAVPALFALAFSAKLRRLRDEVATASRFSHRMAEAVDEIERKLAGDTQVARGLLQRMGELGPDGWAESLQLRKDVQAIKQSIAQGRDHLRVVEEARTESEDLAEAAHEAFERAQGELSAPLDTLLKGVIGHTVVGRVGEESGEELSRVSLDLLSQADGAPRPSFETSGMVGDFLAAIQKERRASRDAWAELRLHVRFVDDEHFHASEKVQGALILATACDAGIATPSAFSAEERTAFVLGFEALLWRSWLTYNDMLGVVPFEERRDEEGLHYEGEVFDGHLVKEHYEDPGVDGSGSYMDGDYYPGAVRLNEGQAKYLYNQFAKRYFERYPGNVPEPLEFDAGRYDELWSMPEANLLGIKSRDRRRRLDEVKVLVIEYFIQGGRQQQEPESDAGGAAKKVRDTVREMLGVEPGENPLDQYLEDMPTFPAPPAAPGLTQTEASDLAELASALASTGGLERRWLAGDARARLESAVIDLDLKVSAYEALPDAASAGDGTAADALQDIEQKQSQVAARHAELLALAADDRELTAAVDAELGERMGELTAWQPERAAGTTWRWYGPDAATGAPPVS